MRPIHCLFILLISLLISCQSDTKSNAASSTEETEAAKTSAATNQSSGTHIAASTEARFVGMWHYETIVGNPAKKEDYVGRWINMKRDNSFTSGLYFEENNSGTWSYDENEKIIKLNFKEPEEIESEWLVNANGDFIIWIGNANSNMTGLQIKMVRYAEDKRPAK